MKLNSYYLEEFIELYKRKFGEEPIYNDDEGIYYFPLICVKIKAWNHKIEPSFVGQFLGYQLDNLIDMIISCNSYWFDKKEEEKEDNG